MCTESIVLYTPKYKFDCHNIDTFLSYAVIFQDTIYLSKLPIISSINSVTHSRETLIIYQILTKMYKQITAVTITKANVL